MLSSFAWHKAIQVLRFIVVAMIMLALVPSPAAAASPAYTIIEIGTLTGFNSSGGAGINESGQVVGTLAQLPYGAQSAFVWDQANGLQALGKFEGRNTTGAAINDNGDVVGRALGLSVYDVGVAYIWNPESGFRRLDAPASLYGSIATGVNNAGQVSGYAGTGTYLAARWEADGQVQLLGSLGGTRGYGNGINEAGQVTGYSDNASGYHHPFLWDPEIGMIDLGTFVGTPTSFGQAFAVNESAHVAGNADSGSFGRAFLWVDGELIPIGPNLSYAYALNDLDHVVGQFTVRSKSRAFLYRDGRFVDLNTLIPSSPRITLTEARGINNAGWIVANGTNAQGKKRAFVLIPR